MPKKQDTKAIAAWAKENTDLIQFRARKHEHLPERVQEAVDQGFAKSRQAYMLEAIRKALAENGVPEWNDGQVEAEERDAQPEEKAGLSEMIRRETEGMSAARKQEVLDFVRFLKEKDER